MKLSQQISLFILLFFLLPSLIDAQEIFPRKTKKGVYYVNEKGKKVNDHVFEDAMRFFGGRSHALVKLNGLWGYVNKQGDLIIEPQFEEAKPFFKTQDFALVKLNGLWGYVNKQGEIAIELQYEEAKSFTEGIALVKKEGKYFLIDSEGTAVTQSYEGLTFVKEGCLILVDGKYGLVTTKDSILVPTKFENFGGKQDEKYLVKSDGEWGYYRDGEFTLGDEKMLFTRADTKPYLVENCIDRNPDAEESQCQTKKLLERVYKNIKYPPLARENGIQGTTRIQFVVNTEGAIENPVITSEVGGGCDEEALRIIEQYLNQWAKPATVDGKKVRYLYRLPIKFKLE